MNRTSIKEKILLWMLVLSFLIATTDAGIFTTNNQTAFDEGTYTNTYYNTTNNAVQLSSATGTYTSKIFDANANATWTNMNWSTEQDNQIGLFVVDGQKAVFHSTDMENWTTQTADYGGNLYVDGLVMTSNNELILLNDQDIYLSSNYGENWTKINDDFTPYSNNGLVMTIDSNDNIYIIDGANRVFKSTDSGYNWTEINSDFNGAVSNDAKGITATSNNTLFAVDGAGGVYMSTDQGNNWTYQSSYGGGTNTDAITADQFNYLYILLNKDIYASINSGINWTKVNNNSFTPYSNNGLLLFFNKKHSLIIVDAVGRVFKSIDKAVTWTELGDCNAGATNDPKAGTAVLYQTNTSFFARSCNQTDCLYENFSNNLSVPDNRYFQYKFEFEADNADYSPKLYNFSINYSIVYSGDTIPPALSALLPAENSSFNMSETIEISANATDDVTIHSVSAIITYPNNSMQKEQLTQEAATNKYNSSFIIPALPGRYNITFLANDSSNNLNNTEITYFTVINTTQIPTPDSTPPSVTNITPLAGSNFSKDSRVDITANVTDNVAVDQVFANITKPDLSISWLELFDGDNDSIYNNSIVADQHGWYYVQIIANDTAGNINNTEGTNFDPASLGGGGGGGGGAGRSYANIADWRKKLDTVIIPLQKCMESWLCTDWTDCMNGKQTRICDDWNKCGTEETKPPLSRECLKNIEDKKPKESRFAITPLLPPKQASAVMGSAGIIAIIILLAISIYLILRKKKTKKKTKRKKIKTDIIGRLQNVYKNI